MATFDPVLSKLLKLGGNLLSDSRQLPGEIVDVLVIRDVYLSRYPESVQYLLNGWYQALALMKQQPREAGEILGLRMKTSVDETLALYEGLGMPDQKENQRLLKQQPIPALLLSATRLLRFMCERGLLKVNLDVSVLFSNQDSQSRFSH